LAVAHDAVSESADASSVSSYSWTHTPSGTPTGILVYTFCNGSADIESAVTYGGESMTAVTGGFAQDTAGEDGYCKAWFLGGGSTIPTGAQTVEVTRTNNADTTYGVAVSVTSSDNTTYAGVVLLEESNTLAEQYVDDGVPGTNSVRYAGAYWGGANEPEAGANSTYLIGNDFGATAAGVVRETTAGQGPRLVGFTQLGTDDRAVVHLAILEDITPSSPCSRSVVWGTDDGYTVETSSTFDNTSQSFEVGERAGGPGAENAFMRFRNVTVPNGATITAAHIEIVATGGTTTGSVVSNIYADDIDDAVAPTDDTEHDALTRTTAFTAWDNPAAWRTGTTYNSPDIASVIQEVVDRAGWVSGNALQILWDDDGSGSNYDLWGATFESTAWDAPLLYIAYTTAEEITDPALSDSDTLNTDSLKRLVSDPALADSDTLTVDTLDSVFGMNDEALVDADSLTVDYLMKAGFTDPSLVDSDTLGIDVLNRIFTMSDTALADADTLTTDLLRFAYVSGDALSLSPYWLWQFVRKGGHLHLIPARNRQWFGVEDTDYDVVSSVFQYNTSKQAYADLAVWGVWQLRSDSSTAALKAEIDTALGSAGFKDRTGTLLT